MRRGVAFGNNPVTICCSWAYDNNGTSLWPISARRTSDYAASFPSMYTSAKERQKNVQAKYSTTEEGQRRQKDQIFKVIGQVYVCLSHKQQLCEALVLCNVQYGGFWPAACGPLSQPHLPCTHASPSGACATCRC